MPPHADVHALPEPWRSLCQKLTAFDRTDRHQSPQEAVEHALELFAASGILLDNFHIHVREMKGEAVTPSWAELSERHFLALPDLGTDDIQTASKLPTDIFTEGFDPQAFFDRLEASGAISEYESGDLAFSAADHLADLYHNLFEHLDASRRLRCFRRLCRTAIRYHRYSVMGTVRETYSLEQSASQRLSLIAILNEEDPERIIEGRGSIPR
jgi:hypothetical protein